MSEKKRNGRIESGNLVREPFAFQLGVELGGGLRREKKTQRREREEALTRGYSAAGTSQNHQKKEKFTENRKKTKKAKTSQPWRKKGF